MKCTTVRFVSCALAGAVVAWASAARAATIFSDDFEAGTAGANIAQSPATQWGKSDITVSTYRANAAGAPFAAGALHADLTDPGPGTNPSQAVRLMSHGNNATNPLIAGQVTTFSFNFFEPTRAGDINSLVVGYYREQANVDLNSGGRNYTSTLHDGTLSPQSAIGGGLPTTYPLDTVNTLFILANDSGAAVANYAGTGLTLAATTADVWISKGGAAPVFAFSVSKQNAASTAVVGVGFRTNNADIERFFVDNVLVVDGATFDRTSIPEPAAVLLTTISCAALGIARRGRRSPAR